MKKLLFILLTLTIAIHVSAQNKNTENTLRLGKTEKGEAAKPDVMYWLEGNWTGKGLGGDAKEVWERTGTGDMMGMFIMSQDGKPGFYEFLLITVDDGELVVKLKHFTPSLVGWEEKDKSVMFRFVKQDKNRYYFNGLTFENVSKEKLNVYVALRQKDGTVSEAKFEFMRSE